MGFKKAFGPLDDDDRLTLDNIERFGWSCPIIDDDAEGPGFGYSVGLMATLEHPELILFGLRRDRIHGILSGMVKMMREGARFQPRTRHDGVLEGYPVHISPVHETWHEVYLGFAMWHRRYVGKTGDLQAVQVVWPDMQGQFPWTPGFQPGARTRQPNLSLPRENDAEHAPFDW